MIAVILRICGPNLSDVRASLDTFRVRSVRLSPVFAISLMHNSSLSRRLADEPHITRAGTVDGSATRRHVTSTYRGPHHWACGLVETSCAGRLGRQEVVGRKSPTEVIVTNMYGLGVRVVSHHHRAFGESDLHIASTRCKEDPQRGRGTSQDGRTKKIFF